MALLNIRQKKLNNNINNINFGPVDKDKISITSEAALKILNILKLNSQDKAYLRMGIKGGGCSGLSIYYEICEKIKPNDLIFEKSSAKVCIDIKSLKILGGSTLHIKENLGVSSFIIINNKKSKECSCGKSFSIE